MGRETWFLGHRARRVDADRIRMPPSRVCTRMERISRGETRTSVALRPVGLRIRTVPI